MIENMWKKQQCTRSLYSSFGVVLFLISSFSMVQADQVSIHTAEQVLSSVIKEEEIQRELNGMQIRLDQQIDDWGKTLTKDDFEWTLRGRMLKQPQRVEICNIFQNVINETYLLVKKHNANLSDSDKKIVENRDTFIQKLGVKDKTISTKMGFSCVIK